MYQIIGALLSLNVRQLGTSKGWSPDGQGERPDLGRPKVGQCRADSRAIFIGRNAAEVSQQLGISQATLYRRIRAVTVTV